MDYERVALFRRTDNGATRWAEFVALLKTDPEGFGYLFDIVDALSGSPAAAVAAASGGWVGMVGVGSQAQLLPSSAGTGAMSAS